MNNNFLFFSDATVDVDMAMASPCAASSHAMWRTCSDHVLRFFFLKGGAVVHRLSEMDNPSSNCPSKLMDEVRRIVPFKIKTIITYLTRIIKRITGLTRIIFVSSVNQNGHFCYEWMSRLGLELGQEPLWLLAGRSLVCFCFFTKIIFKLTIDISMCKIILEVEYFVKSMIYQMFKFFKIIAYFIPRWSEDLNFTLKIQETQVN